METFLNIFTQITIKEWVLLACSIFGPPMLLMIYKFFLTNLFKSLKYLKLKMNSEVEKVKHSDVERFRVAYESHRFLLFSVTCFVLDMLFFVIFTLAHVNAEQLSNYESVAHFSFYCMLILSIYTVVIYTLSAWKQEIFYKSLS